MGYRMPADIATLTFEQTSYAGAEVTVKTNLSVGKYLELEALRNDEKFEDLFREFGDTILASWNLESEDSSAIAATGDQLLQQPLAFSLLLIDAWREAVVEAPAPLGQPSNNGSTTAVEKARAVLETELGLGDMSKSAL